MINILEQNKKDAYLCGYGIILLMLTFGSLFIHDRRSGRSGGDSTGFCRRLLDQIRAAGPQARSQFSQIILVIDGILLILESVWFCCKVILP